MKVVVLGGGESGYGSAVLAKVKGFDVFLSDIGSIEAKYISGLEKYGIEYEHGKHSEEKILDADIAVKSPGIPDNATLVRKLHEKRIPVISEIEFASRYTKGTIIGITGSNGKTTTTTLTGEILRAAGYDVAVGGNIGDSFAYQVATDDKEWYVLELSSFQLDGIDTFHPHIAVITNITPDHLDRYDNSFEKYIDSKFRIIRNMTSGDYLICSIDNMVLCRELIIRTPDVLGLPFTAYNTPGSKDSSLICNIEPKKDTERKTDNIHRSAESISDSDGPVVDDITLHDYPGAYPVSQGVFKATVDNRTIAIDVSRMQIKGLHNIYNAMAATLAALAAGVDERYIIETIYGFKGVEHRMENIGTFNGVEFINDSKATNIDSTRYALDGMQRPTIWIAGGTDKGNNYGSIAEIVRKKVKALVCMGVDNSKLIETFKDVVPVIYDTNSMEEAMQACFSEAKSGDTILLSPACASFDLFRNYEDRGRQFKECVKKYGNH